MGRVALGANSFAAVEAIRGDMGWSSFSERCMKGCIMYKKRIERMDETRWVKKVCEKVGLKSRWLGMCKRVVKKCGLKVNMERSADRQVWQVESMEDVGDAWNMKVWKKVVREKVEEYGLKKWKQGMSGKSTLKWYETKLKPMAERTYDGSYSSDLLFKARSQSLEVNDRTYRWNDVGSRECQVCRTGDVESVYHVIVECAGYERERVVLIRSLMKFLDENFIVEWNENDICKILGLDGDPRMKMEPVKKFLESIWKKRGILGTNVANEVNRIHNDHNYMRL